MTIQAKTPSINIFQVKPKSKKDNRFLGSSSESQNPFIFLVSADDPNVISFESSFEKEGSSSTISVRVVDPKLTLFQKFFTSFNYVDRLRDAVQAQGSPIEGVLFQILKDIQSEDKELIEKVFSQEKYEEDENLATTVFSIINDIFEPLRGEIDEELQLSDAEKRVYRNLSQIPGNDQSRHQLKQSIRRARQKAKEQRLGPLGVEDLNSEVIGSFDDTYTNKRFVVQYSDGTHDSLHFDATLANLRMFSSDDNLLMIDMVFSVGAETDVQERLFTATNTNVGRVPTNYVGLINSKEVSLNIGRGLTTKVNTGAISPDIGPSIENKTFTTFLDKTNNRIDSIQKVIEAAIASFLYEFDHQYDIHNYLVFLDNQVNEKIIRKIEERKKEILEVAEKQTNSRFYRDKNAAYLEAIKEVIKGCGFRVTATDVGKKVKGAEYPWEGLATSYHICVDTSERHNTMTGGFGGVGPEKPRNYVKALIRDMYAYLKILGIDDIEIRQVGSWFEKDMLLNCLSQNRLDQGTRFTPKDTVINPLYYNENDAHKFPLELENTYLKEVSKSYQNRPLTIVQDSLAALFLSPFYENKEKEARQQPTTDPTLPVYTDENILVVSTSSPVPRPASPRSTCNLHDLFINGWGMPGDVEKFSNINNIAPNYFETPVFVFNGKSGNVLSMDSLDENFAFAFFKTQPPAFAKKINFTPLSQLSNKKYSSIKDKFTEALEFAADNPVENYNSIQSALLDASLQLRDVTYDLNQVPSNLVNLYQMFNNIIIQDFNDEVTFKDQYEYEEKKGIFTMIMKKVFEEFAKEYSSDKVDVFGFLEYLEMFARMQKFTHTLKIRTTPMFHIGFGKATQRSCLFVGKVPHSPMNGINDPFDIGLKDLLFNGAYTIVGFKHVANESDCYSEFTLIKPGMESPKRKAEASPVEGEEEGTSTVRTHLSGRNLM